MLPRNVPKALFNKSTRRTGPPHAMLKRKRVLKLESQVEARAHAVSANNA
jgi:hypothetical protein